MKKNIFKIIVVIICFLGMKEVHASSLYCQYSSSMESGKVFNLMLLLNSEKGMQKGDNIYYQFSTKTISDLIDPTSSSKVLAGSSTSHSYSGVSYNLQANFADEFYNKSTPSCPWLDVKVTEITSSKYDIEIKGNGRTQAHESKSLTDNESKDIVGGGSGNVNSGVSVGPHCDDPNFRKPFRFIGQLFTVIKIIIPIIIIAFGVLDFFRAVVAAKDDEIKKSTKSLIMRVIAGVIIFFLPAIVHFIFQLMDDWQNYENDYSKCSICLTEPKKC